MANGNLFWLIKSLERDEVRYVKRGMTHQGEMIFHAVREQTAYDQDAIDGLFPDHPPAQVSALRRQLFNFILRRLGEKRTAQSPLALLKDRQMEVEGAIHKGLFGEAKAKIDLAIRDAITVEEFDIAADLLHTKIRNIEELVTKGTEEAESALFEELIDVQNKANDLRQKKNLYFDCKFIRALPIEQRLTSAKTFISKLPAADSCLSLKSKLYYCIANARAQYYSNRWGEALTSLELVIEISEANSQILNGFVWFNLVAESLSTAINLALHLGNAEKARLVLDKLISFYEKNDYTLPIALKDKELFVELNIAWGKKDRDRVRGILGKIEIQEPVEIDDTLKRAELYFASLSVCIQWGWIEDAEKWLRCLQGIRTQNKIPFTLGIAYLLELLILYDLDRFDEIEPAINRAKYHFDTRKLLSPYEERILAGFRDIARAATQDRAKPILHTLAASIKDLLSDTVYHSKNEAFPILSWLLSRANGKPMENFTNP